MPVVVIDGDLLNTRAKYICHQVNCKGRMGSGVAKQIRARYPEVYADYLRMCNEGNNKKDPFWTFGQSQFVQCNDGKVVINMFAQSSYGYDGALYTDYGAFQSCLLRIKEGVPVGDAIAMPYLIGCGLGGGDWETIFTLIENTLAETHQVELWRLKR